MEVTELVSKYSGWLNLEADWNMEVMEVTELVLKSRTWLRA